MRKRKGVNADEHERDDACLHHPSVKPRASLGALFSVALSCAGVKADGAYHRQTYSSMSRLVNAGVKVSQRDCQPSPTQGVKWHQHMHLLARMPMQAAHHQVAERVAEC